MTLDHDLTALRDHCKSTVPSTNCTLSHPSSSMKIHPGICEMRWTLPHATFWIFFSASQSDTNSEHS